MDGLLDDSRLEGAHDVHLAARPARVAELVVAGDVDGLIDRIQFYCQVWGGTGTVLVPSVDGTIPDLYERPLVSSDVDGLVTTAFSTDLRPPRWLGRGGRFPHPALLIANNLNRDDWYPFSVPNLAQDDPWKLVYAAVLGDLPDRPDTESLFPQHFYPKPPEFEQFLKLERPELEGSLTDLLERLLGDQRVNSPRDLSAMRLASGLRLNTGYFGAESVLPDPHNVRTAAGPNIVVVFGEDAVADAALLWNLRHAHGSAHGLPLGVPMEELRHAKPLLRRPGVFAPFGFAGGRIFVTSASLSPEVLSEALGEASDGGFHIAPVEQVIGLGHAAALHRDQVVNFSDGKALIAPTAVDEIRELHRHGDAPQLTVSVQVRMAPVPISKALRGDEFGLVFGANRLHVSVPSESLRRQGSLPIEWPSSWLLLEAAALDLGLEVRPSQPGHAAVSLLRSLGSISGIQWLAHPNIVRLLYRLAERGGMTWWKSRWTEARRSLSQLTDDGFEALAVASGRDEPAIAATGDGHQVPFEAFVGALGGRKSAAYNWVLWAESRKLIVRGADVRCNHCAAKFWLPFSAIRADIACPGCGSTVDHPFPPQHMKFTYGLGEVVRRVLEVDALDHLFSAHYMWRLFEKRGLVGLHPGVEFVEKGTADVVAEADVLLVMQEGTLIPGEVKRTPAGLTAAAVASVSRTEDRLAAPWSFFAVGQPARDCAGDVHDRVTRAGSRPRFLLSTDQTYEFNPIWSLGQDPFEWDPMTHEKDSERELRFTQMLSDRSPDEPWSAQRFAVLRDLPDE